MFRAFVFIGWPGMPPEKAVRWSSENQDSYGAACKLLNEMRRLNCVIGGDVERRIPGVGWVLCDTDDEQRFPNG